MLPMNTFFFTLKNWFWIVGRVSILMQIFFFFFLLFVIIKPPLTQLFFVGYVCWFGSVHKLTIRLVDNNNYRILWHLSLLESWIHQHDNPPFFQAPSKVDIAALKSRLQRIKKREEELVSAKASSSVYTSSSPADAAPHKSPRHVPTTAVAATSDAEAFKRTVARAKELATKAQRRNEEREAEESKSSETQTQNRWVYQSILCRWYTMFSVPLSPA